MTEKKQEEIPLPKLMEAVLPYQEGIYVTVLNIIQCIALAFLINEVRVIVDKGELSLGFGLRSLVALALILVIWHRYVSESQYLWPMSWLDTLIPFTVGIVECWIVFCVNEQVPVYWFLCVMFFLHVLTLVAYTYAYTKRRKRATEKLYSEFYKGYPLFRAGLLNFLSDYDKWHIKVFVIVPLITLTFLFFIGLFPNRYNGIIFPSFYLFETVRGELFNNFQKALRKDKNIGYHFQ